MIQFLVAAPCSGSGKTTLTCALLAALKRRGQDPCSFKSGPDYIDPMFHRAVLGVESHNLDLFFSAPETVRALYAQAAAGHGAAVCEGAMGFYDGLGGVSDTASAWHLADTLGLPVLLVVQPRGASLTLAAQINGLKQFRTPSHLAGILLNDCAPHLYALLAPMLERETGLPVLGYLPHLPDAALESRHLGLKTAGEIADLQQKISRMADALVVDWEKLSILTEGAAPLVHTDRLLPAGELPPQGAEEQRPRVPIAVARDAAFCFTYAETLEALERAGAELCWFSPLQDSALPEQIGGLYLRLSPSSEDCPNLMAIRRKTLDSYAHLHNLKKRGDSVLAAKISSLLIWYSLQKKDMSDEDKNYLDTSLVECYRRYGITFENDSLVDENGDFKEMPILEDWYNVLQENAETRHLAVVLARYVTGSAAAMGKRNHIDLNNKYIVLDTTGMPADLMLSGIFWATEVANDIIMDFGAEQSALLADELWALAGATSNSHVAGFVLEMVKTIRGLGGIAVTSTQGMQDLFGLEGGKYGKGILDSSRLKIVMQMEEQEARLIQGVLNLSEDEVRQITRFRRGEGLLCFGYNHVPISIYVTPKEYEAITTSPTDRQAMLERRETDE